MKTAAPGDAGEKRVTPPVKIRKVKFQRGEMVSIARIPTGGSDSEDCKRFAALMVVTDVFPKRLRLRAASRQEVESMTKGGDKENACSG